MTSQATVPPRRRDAMPLRHATYIANASHNLLLPAVQRKYTASKHESQNNSERNLLFIATLAICYTLLVADARSWISLVEETRAIASRLLWRFYCCCYVYLGLFAGAFGSLFISPFVGHTKTAQSSLANKWQTMAAAAVWTEFPFSKYKCLPNIYKYTLH